MPLENQFSRKLNRRYLLFIVGFAVFVLMMALSESLGLPRSWLGSSFLISTVVIYAGIGFICRTTNESEYFVAGRQVPAMYNGLATAADWMSAASFVGTAGVLYLNGFAGLAYILGWTGGYCLLALLLVPYLRRSGQYTIPDFLALRYGGGVPRAIGAVAAMMVSFIYLVVQIYGVGLIASHLTGLGFELGIVIGLGGVLVCSFLGGMRAVTWTQVAQYIVLIVAYLVPLAWLSYKQTDSLWPIRAYDVQLAELALKERQLRDDPKELSVRQSLSHSAAAAERKLLNVPAAMAADQLEQRSKLAVMRDQAAPFEHLRVAEREMAALPRTEAQAQALYTRIRDSSIQQALPLAGISPQTVPYAAGDPNGDIDSRQRFETDRLNFIALMLCLMVGTAAMPHILIRFQTTPSVSQARRSVAWALFFIALLYLAAPALAIMVKREIFYNLVGLPFDELPRWLNRWAKLDSSMVSVQDVNGDGILQLSELRLAGDAIVLAAPEIGGLPHFVTCLVAAGALAAALSTADGLLMTIANSVAHDFYYKIFRPAATPVQRVLLSKMLVMAVAIMAATVASLRIPNILIFVSTTFSLAGAAFFPALVFGIFWRRANQAGAIAGMVIGLSVCFYYIATTMPILRRVFGVTRSLTECQWFGIDPTAAGVFGIPAGALAMVLASLLTRPPAEEQIAFVDRIRSPTRGE